MANKYHVNPYSGNPGVCEAVVKCRFGAPEEHHHASPEEARAAYEASMETQKFLSKSWQRKRREDELALRRRTTPALALQVVEALGGIAALVKSSGSYDSYGGGHRKLTVGEDSFQLEYYSEPFIGRPGNYELRFKLNNRVFRMSAVGTPGRWAPPEWSAPQDIT